MKKFMGNLIGIIIVIICGFYIYKVFFKYNKVNTNYDTKFILEKYDYAKIDKTYYKLFKIDNEKCVKDECFDGKDYYVKLLVINNKHISYITVEKEKPLEIEKFNCIIELVESNENEVTLEVKELES